jgi:hypothetical protein
MHTASDGGLLPRILCDFTSRRTGGPSKSSVKLSGDTPIPAACAWSLLIECTVISITSKCEQKASGYEGTFPSKACMELVGLPAIMYERCSQPIWLDIIHQRQQVFLGITSWECA